MTSIQPADLKTVQALARQGDPFAIANLLNQESAAKGLTIRVWKQDCLCILLESQSIPNQQENTAWLDQVLTSWQSEAIKVVKVYGRQRGEKLPAWHQQIHLEDLQPKSDPNLNALALFDWLQQGTQVTNPHLLAAAHQTAAANEVRFLRCLFNSQSSALLPLVDIREVLRIPLTGILPVPDMPECVLGIYNHRGEMLWLVDLGQQLNFQSSLTTVHPISTAMVIIIQSEYKSLGVVVPQVSGIEECDPQQVQPPPRNLFPTSLLPFLDGYSLHSKSPVLSTNALISYFEPVATL